MTEEGTATRYSESQEDVENVEAWAEVIKDLLYQVPCDLRAEVLALASKNEETAREEQSKTGIPFQVFRLDLEKLNNDPGIRHWNTIMRLKSLVIQVFARYINNNNSPDRATDILFAEHPCGTGSRLLEDYIHPPVAKQRRK